MFCVLLLVIAYMHVSLFGERKINYYFTCLFSDTVLSLYKSQEESFGEPVQKINLRGV